MPVLIDLVNAGNNIELLGELLRAGEIPDVKDEYGMTPLHFVASKPEVNAQVANENLKMAKKLIDFGANVNARSKLGWSTLIFAIKAHNIRMTEFLLEGDAVIYRKDVYGNSALHHAILQCGTSLQNGDDVIREASLQIFETLLSYEPNLNTRNLLNRTPLMLAAKYQDFQVVKQLLEGKSMVNLRDFDNNTAMHYALDQEHVNVEVAIELMRYGCRFDIHNMYCETPMTVYIRRLLDASADELEKAKRAFKFFIFTGNTFTLFETNAIEKVSKEKNCQLPQFIGYCKNEIYRMLKDNLQSNYTIYNIAMRGFYSRTYYKPHPPLGLFHTVLGKLTNYEYPVFCDLIVSGICSPFINRAFAKKCSPFSERSGITLKYDDFYLISPFLSHFDLLNGIIAFSSAKKRNEPI